MANRPANAGSGGVGAGSAGFGGGLPPRGDVAPRGQPPRPVAGHRATRSRMPNQSRDPGSAAGVLGWVPYLIVLAGAGLGMFLAVQGAKYAALGTGLLGGSLLIGALLRLALPERYAGLLATRRKASDVLAFAAFGVAVLTVALTLP
jgi:DUF3017 family protein